MMPIKYIFALPETLIVTYTPSPLPPAITSEVTLISVIPNTPHLSTEIVWDSTQTPLLKTNGYSTFDLIESTKSTSSSEKSSTVDSNSSSHERLDGRGGNAKPSKLEIAGIVIGILVGLVTTVATVWMCVRGRHIFVKHERPSGCL
jgi:hypothetical protein